MPRRFAAQFGSARAAAYPLHVVRFTLARVVRLIFLYPINALPQVVAAENRVRLALGGGNLRRHKLGPKPFVFS